MEDFVAAPPKPRERIISTARDLFRKHGIRGIGVDAIADVAGTNKMTLYRHFGSKDDLVIACLREVAQDAEAIWNGPVAVELRMQTLRIDLNRKAEALTDSSDILTLHVKGASIPRPGWEEKHMTCHIAYRPC